MNTNVDPGSFTRLLTRFTDIAAAFPPRPGTALPIVNWDKLGQCAPQVLAQGSRVADDPLPRADILIITWTSAEWFALDHVFVNSATEGDPSNQTWRDAWLPYTRGSQGYSADAASGTLWGLFQMVRIVDRSGRPSRVLLFKSNAHLAHSPWIDGLSAMLDCIMEDAQPDRIYSIGTAGGARSDQQLGDTVVANVALLELQRPANTADAGDGNMARCPTWYPSTTLFDELERKLLLLTGGACALPAFAISRIPSLHARPLRRPFRGMSRHWRRRRSRCSKSRSSGVACPLRGRTRGCVAGAFGPTQGQTSE